MAVNYKFDKFCSIINHKDNNYIVLRTRLQTDCYSSSCDEWVSKVFRRNQDKLDCKQNLPASSPIFISKILCMSAISIHLNIKV